MSFILPLAKPINNSTRVSCTFIDHIYKIANDIHDSEEVKTNLTCEKTLNELFKSIVKNPGVGRMVKFVKIPDKYKDRWSIAGCPLLEYIYIMPSRADSDIEANEALLFNPVELNIDDIKKIIEQDEYIGELSLSDNDSDSDLSYSSD